MDSTSSSIDSSVRSIGDLPIGKIHVSADNEYVIIGRKRYVKSDLYTAFGGTLTPGLSPPPAYNFANPVPLGLSAFSLTTFVLSMYNANAHGVHTPNVVVGLAGFYGGAIQLFAGMWDIILGNTFGGTALCSYGGFWLSFMSIYIESFGIVKAYEGHMDQFENAVGFFLLAWAIFTSMLTLCTLKSTVAFFSLFFSLAITFLLLAIGKLANSDATTRAGGVVGIICAFIGFYNAYVGIATRNNSYFVPRVIPLPN